MKILVDADACPVRKIIVRIAKEMKISVTMVSDSSHSIEDGYSEVVTCDVGKDSVDITLKQLIKENDIVVTQDFGLAELCLNKKACVINQNGMIYNEYNIDYLIFQRDFSNKLRTTGRKTKNHKKRKNKDDSKFERAFRELCLQQLNRN